MPAHSTHMASSVMWPMLSPMARCAWYAMCPMLPLPGSNSITAPAKPPKDATQPWLGTQATPRLWPAPRSGRGHAGQSVA